MVAQGGGRPDSSINLEFHYSGIDLSVLYWLNVVSGSEDETSRNRTQCPPEEPMDDPL